MKSAVALVLALGMVSFSGCGDGKSAPGNGRQAQSPEGNEPDPAAQFAPDLELFSSEPYGVWGMEKGQVTPDGITIYQQLSITPNSITSYITCYYRGLISQAKAEASAKVASGKVEILVKAEQTIETKLSNGDILKCGAGLPRMKLAFEIRSGGGASADYGLFNDEAKPANPLKFVRQKLYVHQ